MSFINHEKKEVIFVVPCFCFHNSSKSNLFKELKSQKNLHEFFMEKLMNLRGKNTHLISVLLANFPAIRGYMSRVEFYSISIDLELHPADLELIRCADGLVLFGDRQSTPRPTKDDIELVFSGLKKMSREPANIPLILHINGPDVWSNKQRNTLRNELKPFRQYDEVLTDIPNKGSEKSLLLKSIVVLILENIRSRSDDCSSESE